jgi:hypothetical protein
LVPAIRHQAVISNHKVGSGGFSFLIGLRFPESEVIVNKHRAFDDPSNVSTVQITRAWAMPCSETFSIKPIRELLNRWLDGCEVIIDPFARNAEVGNPPERPEPEHKGRFSPGRGALRSPACTQRGHC